jgi:hypothetical protein
MRAVIYTVLDAAELDSKDARPEERKLALKACDARHQH